MTIFTLLLAIFFICLSYLSGSICSAVLISQLFRLPDPRSEGSRNPGATNVLRLSGKKYAIMVLVADMLKGLLPMCLAHICHMPIEVISFAALAAVLGHIYPVFFEFQGGKGVATALGVFLGLNPWLGILVIITWLAVAGLYRFSSLASMAAVSAAPIYGYYFMHNTAVSRSLMMITALVLYKHQDNIRRLIQQEEPKIRSLS